MIQTIYDGTVFGVLYALVAIGIVLIYRATGVLNLAQGAIAATAGYLAWMLVDGLGFPVLVALVVATGVAGLVGVVAGAITCFLMPRKSALVQSVATFGFAMALQWLNRIAFGTRARRLDPPIMQDWDLGGVVISGRDLTVVLIGVLIIAGVHLLVNRTSIGLKMRALAQDKETARIYGISEWRIVLVSWFIGSALAGVSGVLVTIFIQIDHTVTTTMMIQSFGAMVLGGFGSIGGALFGGVLLGLVSSITTVFLSSDLKNTIILAFVLIVLIVRPSGLLGAPRFRAAEGREHDTGPGVPGGRSGAGLVIDIALALLIVLALPFLPGLGLPIPAISQALLMSTAIVVLGVSFLFYFHDRLTLGQGAFATLVVYILYIFVGLWGVTLTLPWLIAAVLLTGAVAGLIGWITLRLDGFYFAVATIFLPLGVAEIIGQFGALTNGQAGIYSPEVMGLAGPYSTPSALYWQAAAIFFGVALVLLVVLRSRVGRIWIAIRDTQDAVEASGINPVPYRVLAFALSGMIAALGGYMTATTLSFISPEQFGIHWSILLLLAVLAGGRRLLATGALVGSALIILVPQVTSSMGGISELVLGLALLGILMLPETSFRRRAPKPAAAARAAAATQAQES